MNKKNLIGTFTLNTCPNDKLFQKFRFYYY